MKDDTGMTIIVKTITRFTVWLIMLYGIFLTAHGHLSPGGGFVGGLVIALSFIHLTLAYGRKAPIKIPSKGLLHTLESTGALIFLGVGTLAIVLGYPFLTNFLGKGKLFELFSSGTIPILNFAIALKVGMGVFLVFVIFIIFNRTDKERNGGDDE